VRDGLIIGVKNKTKDDNSFYLRGYDFGIQMAKDIEDDTKSMKELIQSLNNQ
jgi:hypothetical protein